VGVTAYDNVSKQYQSSWIDNMGTSIMYMTGRHDAATKSIIFTGEMDDPMKPGTKVSLKEIIRITSPDSHTMEMYEIRDGKENKMMEIVYTRTR